MSADLTVVHPATGEVLDVHNAATEQLAAALAGIDEVRAELTDFGGVLERELLARLDRRASWTLRVGAPEDGVQYEIKAPSPDAGTTGYDARVLDHELAGLIERRTIDAEGAEGALERSLTVTVRVPFGHDLDALVKAAGGVDAIAGVPVHPLSVSAARKVIARGVSALRKVDGTGRALDRAKVTTPAPARKLKVKPVRQGAA